MTEFVAAEKGTSIRFPSTANLYIDSLDRVNPTTSPSTEFQITKNSNILSGFFTRIAVNEVVLDWNVANVRANNNNNTFTVVVGGVSKTATLPDDFYNVKQALDYIVANLNTQYGNSAFSISPTSTGSSVFLTNTGDYTVLKTNLSDMLDIQNINDPATRSKYIQAPKIIPSTYIDIVSNDLTYCQNLKDGSTSQTDFPTLFRWYLAWDNEPTYDAYGYPILQGYKPFLQRRSIAFPKQIRWDNTQPIGNLGFRVLNSLGRVLDIESSNSLEFNLSCLVSEV